MKTVGIALSGLGLFLATFVVVGMAGDPKGFPPSQVLAVPWLALAVSVGGAVVLRKEAGWPAIASGAVLSIQAGMNLAVISMGVGAGRQNYWDAVHFASVFWCAALRGIVGLVIRVRAARRGSDIAGGLAWIDGALVGVCVVLWAWMTLPPVQAVQGWIARTLYLLTHG